MPESARCHRCGWGTERAVAVRTMRGRCTGSARPAVVVAVLVVTGAVVWCARTSDARPMRVEGPASAPAVDEPTAEPHAAAVGPLDAASAPVPAPVAAPRPAVDAATGPLDQAEPPAAAAALVGFASEPLPTLVAFDPLLPVIGHDDAELAEWTAALKELYFDHGGATGRRRQALLARVRALDPAASVPAFLNALSGCDLADPGSVRSVFALVRDWQEMVAHTPRFSFPGDVGRMDTATQNLRIQVLRAWHRWWTVERAGGRDAARLGDYRQAIQEAARRRDEP